MGKQGGAAWGKETTGGWWMTVVKGCVRRRRTASLSMRACGRRAGAPCASAETIYPMAVAGGVVGLVSNAPWSTII